jgi:hypothetical protein
MKIKGDFDSLDTNKGETGTRLKRNKGYEKLETSHNYSQFHLLGLYDLHQAWLERTPSGIVA